MTEEEAPPKPVRSFWTNHMEAELRELWTTGASASEIAAQMGRGLTRCAIIGKSHRMGLPDRRQRMTGEERAKSAKASKARYRAKMRAKLGKPEPKSKREWVEPKRSRMGFKSPLDLPPAPKPKGEAWKPIEGVTPVSLADIDHGQCKWPVTEDAPFLFCGAHATHGPYCHHHHLWSIGQGTAFERAAEAKAEHAVRMERMVFDDEREAA